MAEPNHQPSVGGTQINVFFNIYENSCPIVSDLEGRARIERKRIFYNVVDLDPEDL